MYVHVLFLEVRACMMHNDGFRARGEQGSPIKYCEASMRNGFGLKYVHKFFNLPFLQLQVSALFLHFVIYDLSSSCNLAL